MFACLSLLQSTLKAETMVEVDNGQINYSPWSICLFTAKEMQRRESEVNKITACVKGHVSNHW